MNGALPAQVLLTLARKPGGQITASLRSRNGGALAVAERLQGGGHPDAAGATLPRTVRGIPDALDYLRRTLAPKSKVPTRMTGLAGLLETFDEGLTK
jgi:nanoRNase/pAp phosphatase (c-di-AMP/oligoRNAs hydrolase)